jgi:hypothetical protein
MTFVFVGVKISRQQGRILGFSNQKIFPHARTVSPNKDEIPIRNKEPDGYQLR